MNKIAVIGSNMVDLITYIDRMPAQGETLEAPNFAMGCGGKGANQAVAAAKLGADVLMLSKVGDDMFADNTLANFKRFGIDTEGRDCESKRVFPNSLELAFPSWLELKSNSCNEGSGNGLLPRPAK